jgi:hypothetical protein
MKVWHCKKAGSEPKGRFLGNSRHWPAANIRTRFTSNKIDNVKTNNVHHGALLNDAIPVKFQVPIGK